MLCCRAALLDEALDVCDDVGCSDLSLTFQQHCYLCSHLVGCFVKTETVKDRRVQLQKIMQSLSSLLDSDIKDLSKDNATDIAIYLDLFQGLRALDRILKLFPESQQAALVQRCISCVDGRIPAGRNRVSSLSSVQSHHSSNSSSRAASPVPSVGSESASSRELSIAELCLAELHADQKDASDLSLARVPHAVDKPFAPTSAASVVAPVALPAYAFVPCSPLRPERSAFLAREIGEINEEFSLTDADRSARVEVVKEIDLVVGKWNPNFKVALYGSFSTGLCDRDSDLDLLIATPAALAYMQTHNFYEPTALPPPPLPPVMLDDLFILFQTDPSLKKRHERAPRQVSPLFFLAIPLIRLQLHCSQRSRDQTAAQTACLQRRRSNRCHQRRHQQHTAAVVFPAFRHLGAAIRQ